jgi:putative membrane protein insertion efficiency factor
MKGLIIKLIKLYQFTFGQLFPRVCRFAPTCSNYAIEAIEIHGVIRGGLLSVWRILRCNPFCPGGWDPVPTRI